ncbi:hypothetical protein CH352_07415 [Leptospira hartskeerlii]|uniref:Uncharacterized protein n=1 Tax=Leptospira hartskeerlii TaxID=2023177 RepID=A0A2M9XFD6_9LEPT|nr:hypothetical protein CH357_07820 [Leptospira hartskeerlii]PJZ34473.1 hypothetical protein CH352_07415 [Leptospira hartskeerlii]
MPDLKKKGNSFPITLNPDSSAHSTLLAWRKPVYPSEQALSKILHCRNSIQTALELRMRKLSPYENTFWKLLFSPFFK